MPVILKPLQYANTATWNGSGTSTVTVNFGFQPDLVWIKPRNNVASNANGHILIDSVRGVDKVLRSHTTGAEVTESNNITAFTSTGITIGDSHNVNKNTTSQYVAWAWKKGATQGFDIVTYTGTGANTTVGHGLGVAPSMMIVKRRDNVGAWFVYHQSQGATKYMTIDTAAATTSSTAWNNTAPTSSVFTVGTDNNVNGSGGTYVAYLFAAVAGYSAFGSYTGNGSADGTFVFAGFRPRFVMVKRTDAAGQNWVILDTSRDTSNVAKNGLYPNLSNAEDAGWNVDILSNGFKPRDTASAWNASGGTYIYAAFSEFPFKNALAR